MSTERVTTDGDKNKMADGGLTLFDHLERYIDSVYRAL